MTRDSKPAGESTSADQTAGAATEQRRTFDSAREHRIKANLPLVRLVALDVRKKADRQDFDLDELCAHGAVGLVQAVDRFDDTRGASFKTFARRRIKGAILDGLRRQRDWFGRRARKHVTLVHLADHGDDSGGGIDEQGRVAQARRNGRSMFEMDAETRHVRRIDLGVMLGRLPPRQQHVIERCDYQGDSLAEAAREISIGLSWACRLRDRARATLRSVMCDEEL